MNVGGIPPFHVGAGSAETDFERRVGVSIPFGGENILAFPIPTYSVRSR